MTNLGPALALDDRISTIKGSELRKLRKKLPPISNTLTNGVDAALETHRVSKEWEAPVWKIFSKEIGWVAVKYPKCSRATEPPTSDVEKAREKSRQKRANKQLDCEIAMLAMIGRKLAEHGRSTIPVFAQYFGRIEGAYVVEYFLYADVETVLNRAAQRQVSISLPGLVWVCRSLLLALGFLDNLGVVHGDIKLSNLFVDHTGRVALADFGESTVVGGKYHGGSWYAMCLQHISAIVNDQRAATSVHDRIMAGVALIRLFEEPLASAWEGLKQGDPFFTRPLDLIHNDLITADPPLQLALPKRTPDLLSIVQALQLPQQSRKFSSIAQVLTEHKSFLDLANQTQFRRDVVAAYGVKDKVTDSNAEDLVGVKADDLAHVQESVLATAAAEPEDAPPVAAGGSANAEPVLDPVLIEADAVVADEASSAENPAKRKLGEMLSVTGGLSDALEVDDDVEEPAVKKLRQEIVVEMVVRAVDALV